MQESTSDSQSRPQHRAEGEKRQSGIPHIGNGLIARMDDAQDHPFGIDQMSRCLDQVEACLANDPRGQTGKDSRKEQRSPKWSSAH
jgi:hypothetical protein